jgi:hypothetical protein
VDSNALAALAGRYRGGRAPEPIEVAQREGVLWLTLPRRPPARLTPLTRDLFAVDGYETLRVRLDGGNLELLWLDEATPRVYSRE